MYYKVVFLYINNILTLGIRSRLKAGYTHTDLQDLLPQIKTIFIHILALTIKQLVFAILNFVPRLEGANVITFIQ